MEAVEKGALPEYCKPAKETYKKSKEAFEFIQRHQAVFDKMREEAVKKGAILTEEEFDEIVRKKDLKGLSTLPRFPFLSIPFLLFYRPYIS